VSSAIDGRSLPPDLQARYGIGRRSLVPIIGGVIGITAFIAALAFVTFNLVSPKVTFTLLAWNDVSADRVDITFEVRRSAEWDVYCVLRAQDESRTDVGYAIVPLPRGTSYVQETYALRTIAPAYVVEVLACEAGGPPERVIPPQFPPGVVPPDQPWTPPQS
jgi:hypothetical protein